MTWCRRSSPPPGAGDGSLAWTRRPERSLGPDLEQRPGIGARRRRRGSGAEAGDGARGARLPRQSAGKAGRGSNAEEESFWVLEEVVGRHRPT